MTHLVVHSTNMMWSNEKCSFLSH